MFRCSGFGCLGVQGLWFRVFRVGRNRFWIKVSLDETVFGRKCHWTIPFLDESVVDEIVFCFG